MKLRRGVTVDQLADDLERVLRTNAMYPSQPPIKHVKSGEIVILESQGKILFNDGQGLYEIQGTKVG